MSDGLVEAKLRFLQQFYRGTRVKMTWRNEEFQKRETQKAISTVASIVKHILLSLTTSSPSLLSRIRRGPVCGVGGDGGGGRMEELKKAVEGNCNDQHVLLWTKSVSYIVDFLLGSVLLSTLLKKGSRVAIFGLGVVGLAGKLF